jgi:hypothetical protein
MPILVAVWAGFRLTIRLYGLFDASILRVGPGAKP